MKEKVYVYIGRFQLLHEAHKETIRHALEKCDRLVLLVGSSNLARDPRNPFTFEERKSVLQDVTISLLKEQWSAGRSVKVDILPLNDSIYNNNKWISEVQSNVQSVTISDDVTLTGCNKNGDDSTFYLQVFPKWDQDFIEEIKINNKVINSTELRDKFFAGEDLSTSPEISKETLKFVSHFVSNKSEIYENLVKENDFVNRYKEQMKKQLPYDTIPFLTGDALVVAAGNVLIGVRKTFPGKDLYALPGGFFDAWKDQNQIDTAIRELSEETKIKVPEKVLRGNIRNVMEFGDMKRSLRWRIITKCVHIQLPDVELPKVKGSDDIKHAFWMPISEIKKNRDKFFEDHYFILETLLGL